MSRPRFRTPQTALLWILVPTLTYSLAHAQTTPLTLEESLRIAVREGAAARAARFAKEVAQVQVDREKPVGSPRINATASGTLQGNSVQLPLAGGNSATVLPNTFGILKLDLEQPLYRPGLSAAKHRYLAQSQGVDWDYRKEIADLCLSVEKAYLNLIRAYSGIKIAKEGLEAAQKYEALVRKQIEAGTAKPVDLFPATASVAEAQAGKQKAENGILLAQWNLLRLLGRPSLSEPLSIIGVYSPPNLPNTPDEAVANALKNRPEIRSLQQNLQAAQAGILLAKTQAQPAFALKAQLAQQTATALLPSTYYAATLEVTLPLNDGNKTRLDTQEAKAQAKRLEALLQSTKEGIELEVKQLWLEVKDAQEQTKVQETQRQSVQALATVAEKAYEVNMGSSVAVQEAQRQVRIVHEKGMQAEYDLQMALLAFRHAQGLLPVSWESLLEIPTPRKGGKP